MTFAQSPFWTSKQTIHLIQSEKTGDCKSAYLHQSGFKIYHKKLSEQKMPIISPNATVYLTVQLTVDYWSPSEMDSNAIKTSTFVNKRTE